MDIYSSLVYYVLSRLKENHLYIKGEKCKFHFSSRFLRICSQCVYGVSMNECKLKALVWSDWFQP